MILLNVDDFLLFVATKEEAVTLRQRLASLLDHLGVVRHATKGFRAPTQVDHHLGFYSDTLLSYFYSPELKLANIAQKARQIIRRATRNARWLPDKDIQSPGQVRYLFLSIHAAKFFLREPHSVIGEKWGGPSG
jgi:hypothetical protein